MNSLHTVIEEMATERGSLVDSITPDMDAKFTAMFRQRCAEAICFDMGHMDNLKDLSAKYELVKLPYPVCWFEGSLTDPNGPLRAGMLCWTEKEGDVARIVGMPFVRQRVMASGAWILRGLWGAKLIPSNKGMMFQNFPDVERVAEGNRELAQWLFVFLSALNCANVRRLEERPPEKLQKARARRGKAPLFSTWTLQLDLENRMVSRTDLGGTHASPRLHLRRGHPRQYAPDKWCWVDPHVVGSAHGLVHKDYAARQR